MLRARPDEGAAVTFGSGTFRSALATGLLMLFVVVVGGRPAGADSYVPVSGAGSTWSQNAIDAWRVDVEQYGMRINYAGVGSSAGRTAYLQGTVDFAASDIPFQFHPEDGSNPETPIPNSYAYIPVTAGGTVFMYNLKINGQRVTNLRLSGENIAKIFTGVITDWNDPAIAADNPGLTMPSRKIVPVVRSDGSGSTAQFTMWMINQEPAIWNDYCQRTGQSAKGCGQTSYYPTLPGMIAQAGDLGVAGYVAQSYAEGAVGYVNYSYALNQGFPVAKMLNAAGYYTEPTPEAVAVSLLKAQINTDPNSEAYLTQQLGDVYTDPDPRTYPLSSYSYMIVPTVLRPGFSTDKGKTLGAFGYFAMCQAQQQSASLGYSPMPINLVQASFDQIRKIPGVVVQDINVATCNNPTFSPDGHNVLADTAPQPQACDKQGPTQCPDGTGGAKKISTPVKAPAPGGGNAPGGPATTAPGSPAPGGTGDNGGAGGTTPGAGAGGGAATTAPRAGSGGSNASGATGVGTTLPGATTTVAASGGDATAAGDSSAAAAGDASDESAGACDPSTGQCQQATNNGQLAAANVAAVPYTLPVSTGWGSNQMVTLIAAVLLLALVLTPGGVWIAMNKRKNTRA
jgi:phosphate ABC transporter phosphate-binding protein